MWEGKHFSLIPKPVIFPLTYSLSLVIYVKQIFDFWIVFQDCIYHAKLSISPFCKVKGQLSQRHVKFKKDQKRAYIRNAGKAGPCWFIWGVVCKSEVMGSLMYGKTTTVRQMRGHRSLGETSIFHIIVPRPLVKNSGWGLTATTTKKKKSIKGEIQE